MKDLIFGLINYIDKMWKIPLPQKSEVNQANLASVASVASLATNSAFLTLIDQLYICIYNTF